MITLEQVENATNDLRQLLSALPQDQPTAISPEWVRLAGEVLGRTSLLVNSPLLCPLKSSPQIQNYRRELLRLRDAVETGQQQLAQQQKAVQSGQTRLRQVQGFVNSLENLT